MFDRGVAIVAARKWDVHGGIEAYARTLAERLPAVAPGRHVETVDSRGKGSLASSVPVTLRAARTLRRLARANRIDVMHLHVSERASFLRKGYLLRIGRAEGLRTVLHHHGADLVPTYDAAPAPFRAWMRATVRAADVNVVLGSATGEWLTGTLGLPRDRWRVVFNALPDLATVPGPRPPGESAVFRPLLLAVLSDRKGVGDYLRALAGLKARGMPFAATVAGGGPDYDKFVRMATELGIAAECSFPGWIAPENVPACLAAHDVYVLPSYREGLPIGILEAMRQARPVVATAVGAIPEALPEGPGVAILRPGDVPALTTALADLAGSAERRRSEGAAARARFEASFSFDRHLQRILDIYRGDTATAAAAIAAGR